ncbi:TM2 domain-containing protein [Metaplanococcus flavidus]
MIEMKNKLAAALLAIFLGDFGAHKFYLGKPGTGLIYLLFFWTGIPAVIGVIEGIIYLLSSEEDFQRKYSKRY